VVLGVRDRGTAEIRSGLEEGQSIVIDGTQKLVDGMAVAAAPTVPQPTVPPSTSDSSQPDHVTP
jgi:hypothetical protein